MFKIKLWELVFFNLIKKKSFDFSQYAILPYNGNYILQTARAKDANHAETLKRYHDMTAAWINQYAT